MTAQPEMFDASVQYGDWDGGCAADDGDLTSIRRLLEDRGLIKDGEFIVGIHTFNGENHENRELAPVYITVLLIPTKKFEDAEKFLRGHYDPIPVRKIVLELSLENFARLFKRFSIAICRKNLSMLGRQYLAEG